MNNPIPHPLRLGLLAVAALITLAHPLRAALVAHDDFETYSSGADLAGLAGGTGWPSAWTAITGVSVSDESISYSLDGLVRGGGNALRIAANADNALSRAIPAGATGTPYFVSFVFQVKGGAPGSSLSGNIFTGWQALDANPSATNDTIGFLGATGKAGARVQNASDSFSTALKYGETYLFVIKYEGWNGSTYTTARVWLNPLQPSDENSSNNTITRVKTVATTGAGSAGMTGLRVRSLGLSADLYYLVDDIRVGTAWADVITFPYDYHDDFESYSTGASLNGLAGGTGWTAPWTAISGVTVSSEAISYQIDALKTIGGGKSLKITTDNDNVLSRAVQPDTSGRPYFASFLFQIKGGTAGTPVSGNIFTGWQAQDIAPSPTNDNVGFLGASGKAGARVQNQSTSFANSLLYGQTYLFVVQYADWNGSTYQTTRVWLNPTSTDDLTSTNPAVTVARTESAAGAGSSGFLGLRARSSGLSSSTYYLVDEIRVAADWKDVVTFPYVVAAGPEWASGYTHDLSVAEAGVFDFSRQLDAPAGKYGAIVVNSDGHFEFENRPGVRARFWGVNLAFDANFLNNTDADALAARLARSGYNSVRLHLFDLALTNGQANSHTFSSTKFAQLDYLFAKLKEKGIYVVIDLFSGRGFTATELASFGMPTNMTAGSIREPFKGLVPINDNAYEAWRQFAYKFLTHVNTQTSLTWAADPALIAVCPVNEDSLLYRISHPDVLSQYETAFAAAHPGQPVGGAVWNEFIYETHAASDVRILAYLRSLGLKALISGSNIGSTQGLAFTRDTYDYVDNHQYWDHPEYPVQAWSLPILTSQTSATVQGAALPRSSMATRIFGRPFTLTEVNFCRPNLWRAEGAVLLPAYAGLQDWDALYSFQYASTRTEAFVGGVEGSFALTSDPVNLLADRVASFLFQRGDVTPATGSIAWAVRPEEAYGDLWRRFSSDFLLAGLVTKIGSLPGQPSAVSSANPSLDAVVTGSTPTLSGSLPADGYISDSSLLNQLQTDGRLPAGSANAAAGLFTSDTGQITLHTAAGTLQVATPASELFVLPPGAQLAGTRVSVTNGDTPAAVSVVALESPTDASPALADANRILVTHLTDALPTGMRFASEDRALLEAWGQAPHLVRRGDAALFLQLPAGDWVAWEVGASGARVRPFDLDYDSGSGRWTLPATTADAAGTRFAYELARAEFRFWPFASSTRQSLSAFAWSGWGAEGSSVVATTHTTTAPGSSTAVPRFGIHNVNGLGGVAGVLFAHNGSSSTASARHDRYVAVSDIAPLSVTGAGSLSLAWSQAATHTGAQVYALVRVNGAWYASASAFGVSTASSSGGMTNAEAKSLDLAGASGLGSTQWHAMTLGNGQVISRSATAISAPLGSVVTGVGFYVVTGSAANRVAFIDDVKLVFAP